MSKACIRFIDWAFGNEPDRSYLVVCTVLAGSVLFVALADRWL